MLDGGHRRDFRALLSATRSCAMKEVLDGITVETTGAASRPRAPASTKAMLDGVTVETNARNGSSRLHEMTK